MNIFKKLKILLNSFSFFQNELESESYYSYMTKSTLSSLEIAVNACPPPVYETQRITVTLHSFERAIVREDGKGVFPQGVLATK